VLIDPPSAWDVVNAGVTVGDRLGAVVGLGPDGPGAADSLEVSVRVGTIGSGVSVAVVPGVTTAAPWVGLGGELVERPEVDRVTPTRTSPTPISSRGTQNVHRLAKVPGEEQDKQAHHHQPYSSNEERRHRLSALSRWRFIRGLEG